MRVYKNIQFSEGINCTLADFETQFEVLLVGLSKEEIKQAYKIATDGNLTRSVGKRTKIEESENESNSVLKENGSELYDTE